MFIKPIRKPVFGLVNRVFRENTGESLDVTATFKEKAESKSKRIVEGADQTVIERSSRAMERINGAGEMEVDCRVTTYEVLFAIYNLYFAGLCFLFIHLFVHTKGKGGV